MARVLAKVHTAVETARLSKRCKRLLVAFSSLLVDTHHLAPSTSPQHLEVLLANLEIAPVIFRIWVLKPWRVIWFLRHHDVGSEDFSLRRLAAICFNQLVQAVEA